MDVETGGVTNGVSLLTLYMAVFDEQFKLLDELDLKIKPDDEVYTVTGKAMEINGINLAEHDKTAITYKQAGTAVYNFLQKNVEPVFSVIGNEEKTSHNPLVPLGHGVGFDCRFLTNTIISKGSWDKFVSYRVLDTAVIARFLVIAGLLEDNSCSLSDLVKTLKLEFKGRAHDAKSDVLASVEVYKTLLYLVEGNMW